MYQCRVLRGLHAFAKIGILLLAPRRGTLIRHRNAAHPRCSVFKVKYHPMEPTAMGR